MIRFIIKINILLFVLLGFNHLAAGKSLSNLKSQPKDSISFILGGGITGRSVVSPLLGIRNTQGQLRIIEDFTDLPKIGQFESISCSGKIPNTICIAVGQGDTGMTIPSKQNPSIPSITSNVPLLVMSTDGGKHWLSSSIPQITSGILNSTHCMQTGSNNTCIAVGQSYSDFRQAFIVVSNDNGKNWHTTKFSLPANKRSWLNDVTCIDENNCIAVGGEATNHPLIIVSADSGKTWHVKSTMKELNKISLSSISCTGKNGNAICTAISDNAILVSSDKGNTWNLKNPSNEENGFYNSVSCTGENKTAMCTIVGSGLHDDALIVVSNDSGNTWSKRALPNPQNGIFNAVYCIDSQCVAVGGSTSGLPFLAVSTDDGKNWDLKKFPNLIPGAFIDVSCIGTSPKNVCIAAGGNTVNPISPFFAISNNRGKTWNTQKIKNIKNGSFRAIGMSIGNANNI